MGHVHSSLGHVHFGLGHVQTVLFKSSADIELSVDCTMLRYIYEAVIVNQRAEGGLGYAR